MEEADLPVRIMLTVLRLEKVTDGLQLQRLVQQAVERPSDELVGGKEADLILGHVRNRQSLRNERRKDPLAARLRRHRR